MKPLFKGGRRQHFSRGDIIDGADERTFCIESGSVAMYSAGKSKRSFLKGYRKGEFFPISRTTTLWSGRRVEYQAIESTVVLSMPHLEFDKLAQKPENIGKIMQYIRDMMGMELSRIDNLTNYAVRQRLLERLDYFIRRFGKKIGDSAVIEIPMSQAEVASSIGARRETVNRLMAELQKSGLVTTKRETIIINSLSELERQINQR